MGQGKLPPPGTALDKDCKVEQGLGALASPSANGSRMTWAPTPRIFEMPGYFDLSLR